MKTYDVALHTLLGKRKGELCAEFENGKISGFLTLLGHTEPITGKIDENGEAVFSGKFITLINTIDFTAMGTVHGDSLQFIIKSGRESFRLTGALKNQRESENW